MLKKFRDLVKRAPLVGPLLYEAYLRAFHGEGRLETICAGQLRGMKLRRFMHSFDQHYLDGSYEVELQDAFISMISPGDVVYDVGANVGYMTLLASKLVGPTGRVVAFEPGAKTAAQLRAQLVANGLQNVEVEECAICDEVGTSQFAADGFSVMAHLSDTASGGTVIVRTSTLDEFVKGRQVPDLIKIDIEGAELLALAGARRLLATKRPALIVELHSEQLSREFHDAMAQVGYSVTLPTGEPAVAGRYDRFVVAKPVGDRPDVSPPEQASSEA